MKPKKTFKLFTLFPAILLLSILTIISCSKKQVGYKISGKINGLGNKEIVIFEWNGKKDIVDTIKSLNDVFTVTGSLDLPVYYYLKIDSVDGFISLFVENSEIQISGDITDLKKIKITGSETENIYHEFNKMFTDKFISEKDSLSGVYNKAEQTHNEELLSRAKDGYTKLYKKQKEFIIDFSKKHLNSVVVPYIMLDELFFRASLDELKVLYSQLNPEILTSKYSKTVSSKITNLDNAAIGKPAPEIVQNDTSGSPVALSSFKGKWVLLDFWSSKCPPCRKDNPNLLKIYNKFKEKGFEILAVSSDVNREEWIQAIKKDKITWPQLSALNRSSDSARIKYCVEYNPYNVLINPEGIIVAKELNIADLESKLGEVFKSKNR